MDASWCDGCGWVRGGCDCGPPCSSCGEWHEGWCPEREAEEAPCEGEAPCMHDTVPAPVCEWLEAEEADDDRIPF